MRQFVSKFKYLVVGIALAVSVPAGAQLIYGNTFPFWNVGDGGLTVTGPTSLTGTVLGTAASAGKVGEVLTGATTLANAVAITTTTVKGTACAALTAGDWDVSGVVIYSASGATFTEVAAGVQTNALSTTMPSDGRYAKQRTNATAVTGPSAVAVTTPISQVNISATTTYCISSSPTLGAGTTSFYGNLYARRVR